MAFAPVLHHELTSQTLKEPTATENPFIGSPRASPHVGSRPSIDVTENQYQDVTNCALPVRTEPDPTQQVFERAPLPPSSRRRQLAVTALIVLANVVQVCQDKFASKATD